MDRAKYTVAIIGAGPAGLSCAKVLADAGVSYVIIDPSPPGGSLHINYDFKNEHGKFANSLELVDSLSFSGMNHLREIVTNTCFSESWLLRTDKTFVCAKFLVIATGVKNKIAGYVESDVVLVGPSKRAFLYPYKNKSVCILGGGSNAFEHAAIAMGNGAASVDIFHRTIRANDDLVLKAKDSGVVLKAMSSSAIVEKGGHVRVGCEYYDVCLVMFGFEGYCPSMHPVIFEFAPDGRVTTHYVQDKNSLLSAIWYQRCQCLSSRQSIPVLRPVES